MASKKKRKFQDSKAVVEIAKVDRRSRDELDLKETFEFWAARQISLKRYDNESDAWAAWLQKLDDPINDVEKVRGEFAMHTFPRACKLWQPFDSFLIRFGMV